MGKLIEQNKFCEQRKKLDQVKTKLKYINRNVRRVAIWKLTKTSTRSGNVQSQHSDTSIAK